VSDLVWIGLGVTATLGALTYGPPVLVRRAAVRRLRRSSHGKLVLTFDDGPYREHSIHPELLALLARRDAVATFFLVGFRAAESPEACEAIAAGGHEIGWHTYWHRDPWRRPFRSFLDVSAGREAIARWQNRHLFRPVRGRLTFWSWLACRLQRNPIVFWTIDARDTRNDLPDIEEILEALRRADGGVVLLHDHHRQRKPEQARFTLELTGSLLDLARAQGWEVCPASHLVAGAGDRP
jgi:peptidoglycan/xylan/chitin deacetylase (PgdA/CDA1 family)